jgi:hypothetical protein
LKVVYHPSFLEEYKKFFNAHNQDNNVAGKEFSAWIKNNGFNPELPLENQVNAKLGVRTQEMQPIQRKFSLSGDILTAVKNNPYKEMDTLSADQYVDMINNAWQNTEIYDVVPGDKPNTVKRVRRNNKPQINRPMTYIERGDN